MELLVSNSSYFLVCFVGAITSGLQDYIKLIVGFLFKNILFTFTFYVNVSLNVCFYTICVCGAHRDGNMASGSFELDLQMVVSCHLNAKN